MDRIQICSVYIEQNNEDDDDNNNDGKKIFVKVENWLDIDNDGKDWVKVDEYLYDGGWGDKGEECGGGAPDQIITWRGLVATFRWDNARDVDFKNLSVREIEDPE
jgi:hypothetical protein